MSLPFTREEFLDVFAAYNERLWPFALVLWLLTAYVFVVRIRANHGHRRFMGGVLATHWAWAALAYHAAFFSTVNPAAWLFSALFLVEAVLLVWHDRVGRWRFVPHVLSTRRLLAWVLITYALLYPAIALAEGHAWPRVPTFGVPCPTTILTIGFLLALDGPLPRLAALIPIVWAFIGGSAAFLLGVRTDLMLLAAGIILAVYLIGSGRRKECLQGWGIESEEPRLPGDEIIANPHTAYTLATTI